MEKIRVVYLASESEVKAEALRQVVEQYKSLLGDVKISLHNVNPVTNPEQPINNIRQCAMNRLESLKTHLTGTLGISLTRESLLISIESGIETNLDLHSKLFPVDKVKQINDVTYCISLRGDTILECHSPNVPVPENFFIEAAAAHNGPISNGLNVTVGEIISKTHPEVNPKNWMVEHRFGGVSRTSILQEQLKCLIGKTLIEEKISYYPNFPKEGVIFKDLSMVLCDGHLLRILVSSIANLSV